MKVFISHSAKTQIGPLQDILQKEGVSFRDSFDLSPTSDISEMVRGEVQTADAVIAVINQDAANVFFEIGIAIALRKPVLALVSPSISAPSFATLLTRLTSDLADTDVLRVGVKQFLNNAKKRPLKARPNWKDASALRYDRGSLRHLIERLSLLRQSGPPSEVERIVGELLQVAEVTAIEEYKDASGRGVDFAVWSDPLRESLGSPILIEVKTAKLNKMSFRVAYSRLARQVQDSDSAAGLLLYFDKGGARFTKPATWVPAVLWFDVEDFARELLRKNFAEVLIERRNRAVHGLVD